MSIAHKYSFYDATSETIIENLSWVQAHALCRILIKKGYNSFYILSTQDGNWLPLALRIQDILKDKSQLYRTIPTPTDRLDDETIATHQLIEAPTERRMHERIPKSLNLTLDIDGLLKQTKSVDISLGGMKIQDSFELPKKNKFILAYVKLQSDIVIEFKIKPLSKTGKNFNSFEIISCNNLPVWKNTIEQKT